MTRGRRPEVWAQRRRRIRAFKRYRARYQRLFDANLFGVAIGRLDGTLQQVNDAFLAMVGYTRADFQAGKVQWREMTPHEWRTVDEQAIARQYATGTTGNFEKEYIRKDGSRVPVIIGAAFLEDDSDRVIYYALDISARKRAEAELVRLNQSLENQVAERTAELALANRKLCESLALVDTLLQTAPIGLAFVDRELRYVRINDELASLHSVPVAAHLGRPLREIIPGIEPQVLEHYRSVLTTGRPITNVELTGERPSAPGERGYWLQSYYPVRLEGEILGVGVVVQDITERKRAEQELCDHKLRLELAIDAAKCGWFDWNVQEPPHPPASEPGALSRMPEGCFASSYYAWRRSVHPEDLPEIERQIRHAFETGELHHMFRVVWPDTTVHWLLTRARAFKDDRGQPLRMIGVDVDVTDLAEARQRVQELAVERGRLLGEAQRALRARDVFLSVASHELKTPLMPLRLGIEALRAELARGDQASTWLPRLDIALRQIDRLTDLVDAILDITQISSERPALCFAATDLTELAREVLARFAPAAAQSQCPTELVAAGPAIAEVDAPRIARVLGKLITNAFRFGQGKPVTLRVLPSREAVHLQVEDRGIGIAPEDLPRIFGRFERAVTERRYGGLGLGLYIARQIVEAHGGTITCSSAPGAGSRFEIVLPRERPLRNVQPDRD